jgi:hypothetical protein
MRTADELWNQIDKAEDSEKDLSGISYQEGVANSLRWALENPSKPGEPAPMNRAPWMMSDD